MQTPFSPTFTNLVEFNTDLQGATQIVVERQLAQLGQSRHDLGREATGEARGTEEDHSSCHDHDGTAP